MEHTIREIEVKYRVDDPEALVDALRARDAVLSAPVRQDDQAYAAPGWSYGQSKLGMAFARLRTEHDRHHFCVKRPVENELACQEHETEVTDREQMHAAVLAMGFHPTVRIVKTRRTARLGRMLLCLDEGDGLGAFFEIEAMVADGRPTDEVQRELDGFARSLGVGLARTTET